MKRILALTLVLLMLIPMVLACGGEAQKENTSPDNSQNAGTETPDGGTEEKPSEDPDTPKEEANENAKIEFSLSKLTVSVGESRTLNTVYVAKYAGDSSAKFFSSSNESVVTIDSEGTIKAIKPGTATVTVTNERKDMSGTCEITVLGTSTTLKDSIHMPPVDSQGSLGTCAHESVTYAQFTIAVSQYINSRNPNLGWNPSSGDLRYIFSPKYTFNFAGAGTEYAYNILMDHGCLTEDVSRFYHIGESSISGPSNAPYKETASWDVAEDMMELALRYRLTGYEEIDYSGVHSGNLTVGGNHNLDLFNRVKQAVTDGNAVVICGWAYYWNYTVLSKSGDIGVAGENCIYSAANPNSGGGDGNHAVTIVGYDDNVEAQIGGITLKGAFLVMNSWGSGWCNDGYVWMMYDAFNEDSSINFLNGANNEYTDVFSVNDNMEFLKVFDTTSPFIYDFTATGEYTIEGKTYTTYSIYDPYTEQYLGYNTMGIHMVKEATSTVSLDWAIIPYTDINPNAEGYYKDSMMLYAIKRPKSNSLTASNFFTSSAYNGKRTCQFSSIQGTNTLGCMTLGGMSTLGASTFSSAIQFTYNMPSNNKAERTSTIYRFSFIDWRTDIEVNKYGLRIEAEVSTTTRENFKIDLLRIDASGNLALHRPWLFEYGAQGMHNEYVTDENNNELKNVISFSGVVNPTKAESGIFTLTYSTMDAIPEGSSYENFLWGIRITGHTSNIKKLKLIAPDGKVLSEIVLDEKYNTVKMDEESKRKESKDYFFDLGQDLKTCASDGQFYLKNVGTGSYIGYKATLFYETTLDSDMHKLLNFTTDPKTGKFVLYDDEMQMVLDIFKKDIVAGAMVKFNASGEARANTQDWTIVYNSDNTVSFRLTKYPEFYFGYDPNASGTSKYVLCTDKDSDYCKWILDAAGETMEVPTVEFNDGNATYTATKPADNEATTAILRVTAADGSVVSETNVTFTGNTVNATVSGLTVGQTYMFVLSDGTYDIGINYIVKCK